MQRYRLLVLAISSALASIAAVAHAEETAEAARKQARMLDRIQVTATRREESAFDVPVATTVIGAEQIERSTPQVAMDLLHGEPGTFVQQTTPGQGIAIVRGLKGSEVLHLVDGFRLNTAIFRNAPNPYMALVDGTAGWMTVNARVEFALRADLKLALRAENLGDVRYREHGTGLDEPGRNFIFSVDWRPGG